MKFQHTYKEDSENQFVSVHVPVLDLVSQIRDVVSVRCIFNTGNPRGSGFWNGEGLGRGWRWGDQFMSNLGPRWTGSYHSKEGSK